MIDFLEVFGSAHICFCVVEYLANVVDNIANEVLHPLVAWHDPNVEMVFEFGFFFKNNVVLAANVVLFEDFDGAVD